MDGHRTLVLMRHAKAEPRGAGGDELRALSLDGRRQASRAGIALLQAGFAPEVVLCSPSVRTRQTADLAITSLGCRGDLDLLFSDRLYSGGLFDLIEELAAVERRTRSVMIVGHEPTMSAAAVRLAGDGSDAAVLASVDRGLRTASCAILEVDCPWSELPDGGARLVSLLETPPDH